MPVEFIGFIGTSLQSEIHPHQGPVIDKAYVEATARAHDAGGFDRALVAFHSTSPESILVANHAATVTDRLGLMIAHRPGNWRRSTSSPAAGSPSTSSPAGPTRSCARTAIT
jgi:alkanesulfonate monooxygenase